MQIEFIKTGFNSFLGQFAPGYVARLPDNLAKHLIDEGFAKSIETVERKEKKRGRK